MSIFTNFLRRQHDGDESLQTIQPAPEVAPPLILLRPEASGVASYSCFSFRSTSDAGRFIEEHLRGRLAPESVLFWGVCNPPAPDAETIVLLRSERPDIAHAFSFTDLPTATDFVRHEMEFGMAPEQVLIYWVAPARAEIDATGRVAVVPVQSESQASHSEVPDGIGYAPSPALTIVQPSSDPEAAESEDSPFDGQIIEFAAIPSRFRLHGDTTQWWVNMIDAMEEALDACVAQKVSGRLAWRRLSSELATAARIQASMPATPAAEPGEQKDDGDAPGAGAANDGAVAAAPEDAPDTGDDPWFVPRPEWQNRPDGPFRGFNSPHGRF